MDTNEIFERLRKIHRNMEYVAWDGCQAAIVYEDLSIMGTSEFGIGTETRNLLKQFEGKLS